MDSAQGNDGADGKSPATAWKTIARVNRESFAAGDSILFKRGGLWREQLNVPSGGVAGKPIRFGAYGQGELPVISGANLVNGVEVPARDYCIYSSGRNYVSYENLNLVNAKRSCFRAISGDHDLTFKSVFASKAVTMAGFEFDTSSHVSMTECHADYNRGSSSGGGYGFQFKEGSADIQLINCEASYNLRRGAQFDTGVKGAIRVLGGEYHHQHGNNQSDGLAIDANDDILIEGVWAHHNGDSTNDSADGIQVSGGSKDPVIRYCRSENNHNGGFVLEVSGGLIHHNISTSNRHGVAVGTNTVNAIRIYNNTTYNNEFGLFIYQDQPEAPIVAKNNVFYGSSAVRRAIYLDKSLSDALVTIDNNCIWGDENEFLIEWKGNLYPRSNYKSYQSATGRDVQSVFADPLFMDPARRDFRLKTGSPCNNRGINLGLPRDFAGNPIPAASPDMGAYESSQ